MWLFSKLNENHERNEKLWYYFLRIIRSGLVQQSKYFRAEDHFVLTAINSFSSVRLIWECPKTKILHY